MSVVRTWYGKYSSGVWSVFIVVFVLCKESIWCSEDINVLLGRECVSLKILKKILKMLIVFRVKHKYGYYACVFDGFLCKSWMNDNGVLL